VQRPGVKELGCGKGTYWPGSRVRGLEETKLLRWFRGNREEEASIQARLPEGVVKVVGEPRDPARSIEEICNAFEVSVDFSPEEILDR